VGVLDDRIVSLDSWDYLLDFMVLHPKSPSGGNPVILGRPWLSTTNAFIGCKFGNMFISHRELVKHMTLYLPAKNLIELENILWYDNVYNDDKFVQNSLQ
jgi:hypothetical protein